VGAEAKAPEHSLGKRYVFKVFTSLANLGLGFIVAGVVPRALGVRSYGDYSFLFTFFQRMAGFLDFRTSTCVYVKISQDREDRSLVSFYAYFAILLSATMMLLAGVLSIPPIRAIALPGQPMRYVLLAALAGLVSWLVDLFASAMDAYGHTLPLEKMRFVNKIFSVALVLVMNRLGVLDYRNFYLYQYAVGLPLVAFVIFHLRRLGHWKSLPLAIPAHRLKTLVREFFAYSSPLFAYSAIVFGIVVYDRWMLEVYGGSSAQGLYAFGFGFMTYGYIFTNAVQPLMMREMSMAVRDGDREKMANLYAKSYPLLFAVTAYFSAFLFVQADRIVAIFGGSQFSGAATPFRILLLYPLINVFSGLNSSIILSGNRTRLFLQLSLIFTPIACGSLFFLVHPSFLALGATGLAIKVVGMEVVSLVTITTLVSRKVAIRPARVLFHFAFLGSYLAASWGTELVVRHFTTGWRPLAAFFTAGLAYTTLLSGFAAAFPAGVGLSRREVDQGIGRLRGQVGRFINP
jgi:O-antigen/teichoic acid export membrane protein